MAKKFRHLPYMGKGIANIFKKPVTVDYPAVEAPAKEGYRGRISYNSDTCIGCGLCIRVCAPGAITKTVEKTEEGDLITMKFSLDSCTYCGMCSDFCAKKSITLTDDYCIVGTSPDDFIVSGSFLKKPPVKKVPTA